MHTGNLNGVDDLKPAYSAVFPPVMRISWRDQLHQMKWRQPREETTRLNQSLKLFSPDKGDASKKHAMFPTKSPILKSQ